MDREAPFIMRFGVKRSNSVDLPGSYSNKHSLRMIMRNGNEIPLIADNTDLIELATKTKAEAESEDCGPRALLELLTKTRAEREQDDERLAVMRELATKTDAVRERDD